MFRTLVSLCIVLALGACATTAPPPGNGGGGERRGTGTGGGQSDAAFAAVVNRVEPVAERYCRDRGTVSDCDFRILLDTRAGAPPNAFQTVDRDGRPILIVTRPLLRQMRNRDEIAFVLSHEAAHHVQAHLPRTQQNAIGAATLAGLIVAASGGNAEAIASAQDFGGMVGSRAYSKDFELEADAVGTIIAHQAGYDPLRGAEFFARIPDPGDRFLGTHPPNKARQDIVREVAGQLR